MKPGTITVQLTDEQLYDEQRDDQHMALISHAGALKHEVDDILELDHEDATKSEADSAHRKGIIANSNWNPSGRSVTTPGHCPLNMSEDEAVNAVLAVHHQSGTVGTEVDSESVYFAVFYLRQVLVDQP